MLPCGNLWNLSEKFKYFVRKFMIYLGICVFLGKNGRVQAIKEKVPPLRLERRSLPPEGSALSTELWGRCGCDFTTIRQIARGYPRFSQAACRAAKAIA
jgi:hypothetical protein